MFPSSRTFLGLVVVICASFGAGLQAAPQPIEAYAALPRVSEAVLSPDGDRVAVLQNDPDGTSRLVVANVETGRLIRSVATRAYTDFERRDRIESITWLDADQVGYVVNANRPLDRVYSWEAATIPWEALPFRRLTVLNLQTGKSELVLQGGIDDFFLEVAHVVAPVQGDPGFGRVTLPKRGVGAAFMSAYRVSLQTGKVGARLV